MFLQQNLRIFWLLLWIFLPICQVHTEVRYTPPPQQKQLHTQRYKRLPALKKRPPLQKQQSKYIGVISPIWFMFVAGIGFVLLLCGIFAGLAWLWMIGGILTSLGGFSLLVAFFGKAIRRRPSATTRAFRRKARQEKRAERRAWRKANKFYQKAIGRFFKTFGIIVGIVGLIMLPFIIGFFWFGIGLIGLLIAILLGVLVYVLVRGETGLTLLATLGGILLTLGIGGLIYGLLLQWVWMWILSSVFIALPLLSIAAIVFSFSH